MKYLIFFIVLITLTISTCSSKVLLKINYHDTKCSKGYEASYSFVSECSIVGRFTSNKTDITFYDELHANNKTAKTNYCNNYEHPTVSQKLDKCLINGHSSSIFSVVNTVEPKNPTGAGNCEFYFYPSSDCSNNAYKDVLFNNVCFQDNANSLKFKYTQCNSTHTNEFMCDDSLCKKNCKINNSIPNGPTICAAHKQNNTIVLYRSFKKN